MTNYPADMSDAEKEMYTALLLAQDYSHTISKARGWYTDPQTKQPIQRNIPEMIALCHSELSEALEGHRKNLQDDHLPEYPSVTVELADLLIRVFDLCGYLKLDLAGAYIEKSRYNKIREDHSLEARAKEDGKKF